MPLAVQSTTEEKVPVTLSPTTASGKPADIQAGSLVLEVVSGAATAVLDPADPSGKSFFVVSEDGAGSSQVKVSADADLGEGVSTISDLVDYTYVSPQASNLGLAAGAPVPK